MVKSGLGVCLNQGFEVVWVHGIFLVLSRYLEALDPGPEFLVSLQDLFSRWITGLIFIRNTK